MMKRIVKYITAALLLLIIFTLSIANFGTARDVANTVSGENQPLSDKITRISEAHKENFSGREELIDTYGMIQRVTGKRITGDMSFIKDEEGTIQNTYYSEIVGPDSNITRSVLELNEAARRSSTPMVYVTLPERAKEFPSAHSGELEFYGTNSRRLGEILEAAGVPCIDLEEKIESDVSIAEMFGNGGFYFATDAHCTTRAEFWASGELARYLTGNYGLQFYQSDVVFDLGNYKEEEYPLLGDFSRAVGRYYAGVDQFEIFHPQYGTDVTFVDKVNLSETRGTFEKAVLNGYEEAEYDEQTYWITDFGHFPLPYYQYINNLAPEDAPSLLVVCDSTFMRGFSYLIPACREVTVADPRYFNGTDYMLTALEESRYDAIVFVGQFDAAIDFHSLIDLPDLPSAELVTQEEYGTWIADRGFCVDAFYNGERYAINEYNGVPIVSGEEKVLLFGWAVDFRNDAPFQAVYLKAGNSVFQCKYKFDQQPVVDFFSDENIRKTGLKIEVPVDFLTRQGITEVSFFAISADGEFLYEPVTYQLVYI